MRRHLPLILLVLGIVILLMSLNNPFKEEEHSSFLIEPRTIEIVDANASSLIIETDVPLCLDARVIKIFYITNGSSIQVKGVHWPLLRVRDTSTLTIDVSKGQGSLKRTYTIQDGGYIIPVDEGYWEVNVSSNGEVVIYEIETMTPVDPLVTIDTSGKIHLRGGKFSLLLINTCNTTAHVRVLKSEGEDVNIALFGLGLAIFLLGVARARREHIADSGRRGGGAEDL